jgi:hypothetical protein
VNTSSKSRLYPIWLLAIAQKAAGRREVQLVSTWPFDGTNLLRIAFYLLLIPLTWVGAALVENLVELFLV